MSFTVTYLDVDALIDRQLSPERKKIVLEAIMNDEELRDYYNVMLRQKNLLLSWWEARDDRDASEPEIQETLVI